MSWNCSRWKHNKNFKSFFLFYYKFFFSSLIFLKPNIRLPLLRSFMTMWIRFSPPCLDCYIWWILHFHSNKSNFSGSHLPSMSYWWLKWLQDELKFVLREKRFVFVIDNIGKNNLISWYNFKTPFECVAFGSFIIVITRITGVESISSNAYWKYALLMGINVTYKLWEISHEASWFLFLKCAFGNLDSNSR